MRYICFTVLVLVITITTARAASILDSVPPLSFAEKERIVNYAARVQYGFSKIKRDGKTYFQVNWLLGDSMINQVASVRDWIKRLNFILVDFVLRDSLSEYEGIYHVLKFTSRKDPINFYCDAAGGQIPKDSLLDLSYEPYTVKDKVDIFLANTFYKAQYQLDTINKTIYFLGIGMYRDRTADFADFIFAYVLRNRHDQFNKVVFKYRNYKGQSVQDIYTEDKEDWYKFEQFVENVL